MYANFEDKGKIFTPVVSKEPVDVILQTTVHRIIGKFHVRPDERLIDQLNHADAFLALTDATVMDLTGGETLYTLNFMVVQRNQIVWMAPTQELHNL